jgi:hypothetical protein
MRWSHIYVPVLPKKLSEQLLQCPTPFFIGMHRECFDGSNIPSDVCWVDLDNDVMRPSPELKKAPLAGRRLARALDRVLRPAMYHSDDAIVEPSAFEASNYNPKSLLSELSPVTATAGATLSREAMRLCKLFVADILLGVEECCAYATDHNEVVIAFDETMFANFKSFRSKDSTFPLEADFVDQLMRAQSFSLCIASVILRKLKPESRPASRPSSPFISIPSPTQGSVFSSSNSPGLPNTPVQFS